ncbi:MAG TPA: ABC transporter permease [Puia sp.]|nr:ABC transporter permease [Puia sp.]
MLKNYIRLAWRNLMKNKFFSFVNIFGLSAGLACCMLISLYLNYETSYDSYHKHINDLYQVGTTFIRNGEKDQHTGRTPAPMAQTLKKEFPEVEESARMLGLIGEDKTLMQYIPDSSGKKSFLENKGALADPAFFKIFTYDFTEGSPAHSLENPFSIVISTEIAQKFFGDQPALNKVIHVVSTNNGSFDYTVTGVFRPFKISSHIDTRFFMTFKGGDLDKYIQRNPMNFAINNMFYSYLKLRPGASAAQLEAKLPEFMKKYATADLKARGFDKRQFLVPVKDIHLTRLVDDDVTPPASRTYLYILASIAVFTLLIACINFMNLSTARSSKRSTEVGIRKVLGAEKNGLVRHFLGESLIMTMLAFMLAIGITVLLLPLFDQLSGKDITLSWSGDWKLFSGFLVMAVITGLIAGSYPAFYLSSFNPVKVLKGKLSNSLAVVSIRRGLVVFQFMISVVLIIATVVIARQMHYLRTTDMGFEKDQQLVVKLRSHDAKSLYHSLKAELKNNNQVLSVGATMYYPGIHNSSDNEYYREGQSIKEASLTKQNYVDEDLMKTLGIEPVAGRLFSVDFPADTAGPVNRMILNETAVRTLGFASAQDAIGKKIFSEWQGVAHPGEVIGVVKDFHFEDLHVPVTPYAFGRVTEREGFEYLIVHARAGNIGQVVKAAQTAWKKFDPNEPFEYNFLDDQFQKNYEADNRLAGIVGYFTVIAILISCLGLFGLAAFSAEQRTKEIGVRKVLGASVNTIVSLLSVDFLKLILVSVVIASPIAWWVMNKWLQGFAYRQPLDWMIFVYTALIAVLIGIFTIGFQSVKAALANPVKSLRSE